MLFLREVHMTTISRIGSISLLALSLAVAACGGSTAADGSPQTAQNAATTAPVGVATHGPVKMVGDALGQVPLRADQRTELEKLATDAEARHQSIAPARKDLVEAVAAQVEAGTLDRAGLQPKIDAVAAAMESVRTQDHAALERIHALLDSSQRATFVDAMHAQMKGARGHHGGHEAMQEWATDLKLTDAQRDQIKAAFHDKMKDHKADGHDFHAEMKDHHAKGGQVMEAFKSDKFVMADVAPKHDVKAEAAKMSGRMLGMIETVLPILTPEQRKLAADKIRAKAGDAHGMF
jgi:Spy/CpxP family protein refolding chaperone